jgi:hypothetical protein
VTLPRLGKERHAVGVEHARDLTYGGGNVRDVMDCAHADRLLKDARLEWQRFQVAGDGANRSTGAGATRSQHVV